ncbi:hypothetical protein [Variovorax sp. J31P207]|uniref:hypothetical protein n=1 Tax=Variovorax sp. J31P207 TaxID=3053510 RepID=UPI0025782D77|nr:hypothetical protein [Variovorax sp. J31P207]MDM0069573.1 hypothetical protein [Variovorax sp. J31P207]
MDSPLPADNPAFHRWTEVTDAFAREFNRLQAGDQGALAEVRRLSGELQRMGRALGLEMPTASSRPPSFSK